jgi:hypothetical protein
VRVVVLLLLLAGCASKPAINNFYITMPAPAEAGVEAHKAAAVPSPVLTVERHKAHLVAEADRYVSYDRSKPSIIRELARLRADADVATENFRAHPRSAEARQNAKAKVEALSSYLQNKPDSRKVSGDAPPFPPDADTVDYHRSAGGAPP